MMWLNISDVAERGIRVTLLSSLAKETVVAIPTRYGDTKFEEKLSFDDQPLRAATRRSVARMGRSFLVLFF